MTIELLFQDGWQRLKSLPDDPHNSISLGKSTSSAQCFALIFPVSRHQSMPFGERQSVIDGIHHSLGERQALIEVDSGITKSEERYIYSIIKSQLDSSGVQYFLRANIESSLGIVEINAFFDEVGITGQRDSTIFSVARNQGVNESEWMRDPYDDTFRRSYMMNISEEQRFDNLFPEHPLSQARKLIHTLCN
ncbi:MAG: hypothetical protein J5526_04020 [Bacteroidales bacterium]|nr:hypothetical protein [Bacteroidales bacterium]